MRLVRAANTSTLASCLGGQLDKGTSYELNSANLAGSGESCNGSGASKSVAVAIDPKQLALFALGAHDDTPEGAAAGRAAGAGSEEEGPERGLALRFVRLESKCWGAEATSPDLA